VSRPALEALAAQLSTSLSEMSAALRTRLGESSAESALAQAPPLDEARRVDSPGLDAAPFTESPFRRPSVPMEKAPEPEAPPRGNGLLDAVVAVFRRLVGSAAPAQPPVPTRPMTKRFRTARHRVRKR
jgi:hypothetical protein